MTVYRRESGDPDQVPDVFLRWARMSVQDAIEAARMACQEATDAGDDVLASQWQFAANVMSTALCVGTDERYAAFDPRHEMSQPPDSPRWPAATGAQTARSRLLRPPHQRSYRYLPPPDQGAR